jgi:hypothetical protein
LRRDSGRGKKKGPLENQLLPGVCPKILHTEEVRLGEVFKNLLSALNIPINMRPELGQILITMVEVLLWEHDQIVVWEKKSLQPGEPGGSI